MDLKHAVITPVATAIKTGVVDYTYKVATVGSPVAALPVGDTAILYYNDEARDEGQAFNADATALVEDLGQSVYGTALVLGVVRGQDTDLPEGVL